MCVQNCVCIAGLLTLPLSAFVYVCIRLSHRVWTGNTLRGLRCAHNPLKDIHQSLNTNPISVTAGREATTSAM